MTTPTVSGAPQRGAARRALLAAIAPADDTFTAWATPRELAAVDWEWLFERAAAHRVSALLASRIECLGPAAPVPEWARARLAEIRRQAVERAEASRETLRQLAADLERREVPFLLIKGSVLAELVYADPFVRPFYDLDIVVHRDDLSRAEELLLAWGYRVERPWRLLGGRPSPPIAEEQALAIARRFYLRRFHNLSYDPPRGDPRRPIELHWHIVPRGRLRVEADALWRQAATATVAGIEVRTLAPEARLLHLAVHALEAWFHGFKLLHLCDVAWTVERTPVGDPWPLAAAWGATHHLELALHLADRCFDVPAARVLLAGRRSSPRLRAALRLIGRAEVLVDRDIGPQYSWGRRAAIELAWGFAVAGLRAKLDYSAGRRLAAARFRLSRALR